MKSGSEFNAWSGGTSQSVTNGIPTSSRYIILHVGTLGGFVSSTSLISVSSAKLGDYCNLMNGENFEHWMLSQLLPNLKERSVITMDNAPYHNVLLEKP
jgi:hypothetical protein